MCHVPFEVPQCGLPSGGSSLNALGITAQEHQWCSNLVSSAGNPFPCTAITSAAATSMEDHRILLLYIICYHSTSEAIRLS